MRNGSLHGERIGASGPWLIDARSIAEHQRIKSGSGRYWSPATSWALLELLSGRTPNASATTLSRARDRIKTHTAEQIARKTATRARTRRFAADDVTSVARDLALTGQSAADQIDANLTGRARTVEGYVDGDVAGFARDHLLIEDQGGEVIIYETNWHLKGLVPDAVVAADLARSIDVRARAAGLEALERIRQRWLSSNG